MIVILLLIPLLLIDSAVAFIQNEHSESNENDKKLIGRFQYHQQVSLLFFSN